MPLHVYSREPDNLPDVSINATVEGCHIKHSFGADIPVTVDYRYDREPTSARM